MIDTHIHIDEEAYEADREEVIARQREAGVEAMIVPGVNSESIRTVMEVCHAHPGYCYPALGLHPEDVKADWQERLEEIKQAIRNYRDELVAVGEIGLDYYWDKTYKTEQQEVLRQQIALARELNLPVILHNREATEDLLCILEEVQRDNVQSTKLRGVFHCFNGSKETAQRILKMGLYLGIGGVLTFKNCKLYETHASPRRTQREPIDDSRSGISGETIPDDAGADHCPDERECENFIWNITNQQIYERSKYKKTDGYHY